MRAKLTSRSRCPVPAPGEWACSAHAAGHSRAAQGRRNVAGMVLQVLSAAHCKDDS
jgi:hypothetical protein